MGGTAQQGTRWGGEHKGQQVGWNNPVAICAGRRPLQTRACQHRPPCAPRRQQQQQQHPQQMLTRLPCRAPRIPCSARLRTHATLACRAQHGTRRSCTCRTCTSSSLQDRSGMEWWRVKDRDVEENDMWGARLRRGMPTSPFTRTRTRHVRPAAVVTELVLAPALDVRAPALEHAAHAAPRARLGERLQPSCRPALRTRRVRLARHRGVVLLAADAAPRRAAVRRHTVQRGAAGSLAHTLKITAAGAGGAPGEAAARGAARRRHGGQALVAAQRLDARHDRRVL